MVIRADDQTFSVLVKESISLTDLLTRLGRSHVPSSYVDVKARIRLLNLSIDHFTGASATKSNGKWRGTKLSADEILVKGRKGTKREKIHFLKSAMIESGFVQKCEVCDLGTEWNGKPILLQVDHKNGDSTDNRRENLRFLCPNCHSQTDTYGHKNIKTTTNPYKRTRKKKIATRKEVELICRECLTPYRVDKYLSSKSKFCSRDCYNKSMLGKRKIVWPDKEEMSDLLKSHSVSSLARTLGVSDKSVSKYCKKIGLGH